MAESARYVEKTRTWQDNWNNVIRRVLFQDSKLKELMLVPVILPRSCFFDISCGFCHPYHPPSIKLPINSPVT